MFENLDILTPPGLPAIKQCEMYTNLRAIVPDEYKYFYPRPSNDKIEQEAERKMQRRKKQRTK